jgi:hypothetical protein
MQRDGSAECFSRRSGRIQVQLELLFKPTHKLLCIYILRCEIFTTVTMKNAVFWDMKAQFVPHRKYITSPLQRPAGL